MVAYNGICYTTQNIEHYLIMTSKLNWSPGQLSYKTLYMTTQ